MRKRSWLLTALVAGIFLVPTAQLTQAAAPDVDDPQTPAPELEVQMGAPTWVAPGKVIPVGLFVFNRGNAPYVGDLRLTLPVPGEVSVEGTPSFFISTGGGENIPPCNVSAQAVECEFPSLSLPSGAAVSAQEKQLFRLDPLASEPVELEVFVEGDKVPSARTGVSVDVGERPYGLRSFTGSLLNRNGTPTSQAGSTPDRVISSIRPVTRSILFNQVLFKVVPDQQLRDGRAHLPAGFLGNPQAVPTCPYADLAVPDRSGQGTHPQPGNTPSCAPESQVGLYRGSFEGAFVVVPVYNVEPPPGSPAAIAFTYQGVPVVIVAKLREDLSVDLVSVKTNSALVIAEANFEFWGDPTEARFSGYRGICLSTGGSIGGDGHSCPTTAPHTSFIRTPTRCDADLTFSIETNSYLKPDVYHHGSYVIPKMAGCDAVPFDPEIEAKTTSRGTEEPSGLNVVVSKPNFNLTNPRGISESDVKKAVVTLPKGVTVNPSQAEGLGACSEAQYESSELSFHPEGQHGCPSDSKIGTVNVKTPLLEENLPGNVYVATPYDNPFGSLLALYVVIEEPQRGVLIKLAGKVETDPVTGQIKTTFEDLPQQPFASFEFKFREGARAPLVTPQACGSYETKAEFTPWANPDEVLTTTSSFEITSGIGGSPCPTGGTPPFEPGLIAGTRNNSAGSYSPFDLRLFRTDAEQQFTNFSIKLPPGLTGKLAGIPFCPDAAIEAAKSRSGAEELASPACPQASEIGRTLVGAGVGSVQTYVPGKIYLAGPFNGSALSIASVTAAKVGPFDLGTVVVRLALRIDPVTAEVFVDPTGSDPLPHIIDGIPTKLRDIRAYVERPQFTRNPTSCKPTSTASTVLGSGWDFGSTHDDEPVVVSTRFQAADCAALAFRPKLSLRLIGGTKRGDFPKLRAQLRMRKGEANIAKAQVTLPRSAFLEQSHIGTVCTRVQYAKDACPARSVYGYAKALTPLLDEPIQGPVYLRSSEHKLPDLVAALKSGKIEIDLSGRIDSFGEGRIRSSFETVPDAPVSSFVLTMQGGKKGLIVNSANLCRGKHRAIVAFDAHNGKVSNTRPAVKAKCGKGQRAKRSR